MRRMDLQRPVVLVVDDDLGVQEAVREELMHRSYEVVIAPDGASALKLLESVHPDVLVLDLHLPNVSGPLVAARVQMMKHRPRLLICSANPSAEEIAADVDADAVLLKPFQRADLRHLIERLLGSSPAPPA